MTYKALVKGGDYCVWQNETTGELLYTGILGEIARAPKTFVMRANEVERFKAVGRKYLLDLKFKLEADLNRKEWKSRFIPGFDKLPETKSIIDKCAWGPLPAEPSSVKSFVDRFLGRK